MLFFVQQGVKIVRKKLLAFGLALTMIVSTTPSMAFAASNVKSDKAVKSDQSVSEVMEVNSLDGLKDAIAKGGKIKLTGNIEYSEVADLVITKTVDLDLNGFKILSTGGKINHYIMVIKDNGALTVNDSQGSGSIEASSSNYGYGIQLKSNSKFVMNGGTIKTTQETVDIYTITENVKIEINGGNLISTADSALAVRGDKNIQVDINGGKLDSNGRTGVYVSTYSENPITFNITGGTITHKGGRSGAIQVYSGANVNVSGDALIESSGGSAIQLQSGAQKSTLNMSGGTIKSSGWMTEGVSVEENSEFVMTGGTIEADNGAGVLVEKNTTVNISGGTITTNGKDAVEKYFKDNETAKVEVSGGQFKGNVPEEFISKDATTEKDENGNTVVIDLNDFTVEVKADKKTAHKDVINLEVVAKHSSKSVTFEYQWYKDGKAIEGANKDKLVATESGSYTVNVKAKLGEKSAEKTSEALACTITDHDFDKVWKYDKENHWLQCKQCDVKKDVAAHVYGEWKVTVDPTFAKEGVKERTCNVCGAKEQAKIAKLDASKYSVDKVTGIKTYIKGDKKTFTVKFNKVSGADNYTVAYKLNGAKKWTYKSTNGATTYKMKLKAGDTIEARVCANKTVADKTFRSKYSSSSYRMVGNHDVKSVMSYSKKNLALSWAKAKNNYKGGKLYYNVAYRTNNGDFKVKSVSANKMNLKVVAGKYYQVKVRPVIKVGSKKYVGSYEGTYANRYAKSSYIKSLRAGNNKLKVTISKVSGVTGYQVVYAPNKSFKGQKYYTNKGSKNVKRTISNLKSGKRYYVKVRTYKQVNGVKYYGPYSKVINLKAW